MKNIMYMVYPYVPHIHTYVRTYLNAGTHYFTAVQRTIWCAVMSTSRRRTELLSPLGSHYVDNVY
jgi:hypothetical protein